MKNKNCNEKENADKSLHSPDYVSISFKGNMLKQTIFWILVLILFILFLRIFRSILPPFIFGIILAYFLNPVINFLQKFGFSRLWGTVIITIFVIILFIILLTIFIPIISLELQQFVVTALPSYIAKIQLLISKQNFEWIEKYLGRDTDAIHSNIQAILGYSSDFLKSILNSLLSSGKFIVDFVTFFIVVPVVAFYLLLDWERMVRCIDSCIPRDYLQTIRSLFYEMDKIISGFIRGQGTLCLLLAIYYSVALTIIDLNYSLLLGILIGLIAFIPYFGSMFGFLCTIWAAWNQFSENWILLVIVAIFLIGQFLENYILQPKLVGSSVGLHPVWLIFSLFAFGSLFGFAGMLVAIPASAALGTLVRFGFHTYQLSPLYLSKYENCNEPTRNEKKL